MRRLTALCMLFTLPALGEDVLVRDPFWPQGYEGLRYPITTEPRIKPKPKSAPAVRKVAIKDGRTQQDATALARKTAEEARKAAERAADERRWRAAREKLSFGSTMGFRTPDGTRQTAIVINTRTYAPGDFVSVNCDNVRYTWKIDDILPEGKIKLRRVKCGAVITEQKP